MNTHIAYTAAAIALDAWADLWMACWGFTRRRPPPRRC